LRSTTVFRDVSGRTGSPVNITVSVTSSVSMEDTVHEYYDTIDEKRYDDLSDILDPEVVHYRPSGTLEGREEFVEFMRDERPMEETTHKVDGFYGTGPKVADGTEVVAFGRVVSDEDDETLFDFLDLFVFEDNAIKKIRTYTP